MERCAEDVVGQCFLLILGRHVVNLPALLVVRSRRLVPDDVNTIFALRNSFDLKRLSGARTAVEDGLLIVIWCLAYVFCLEFFWYLRNHQVK